MKKILSTILILAVGLLSYSCKKDGEEPLPEATVAVEISSATSTSVTFSLSSENAVKLSYAVYKKDVASSAKWTDIEATEEPVSITVSSLEENTSYVVAANATNAADVVCANVEKEFVTTSLPMVSLEVLSYGTRMITIKVSTINSDCYGFAVVEPSQVESTEIVLDQNAQGGEHIIEGLNPNFLYSVLVQSGNAAGERSEIVLEPVRTEAEAVVTVENVETDEQFAAVRVVTNEDASKFFYVLTKKGAAEPSKDKFIEEKAAIKGTTLYFYELETGSEYTLWLYAQNKKGFDGDVTSENFVVEKSDNTDYGVVVSDITPFGASVNISWNTEKYATAYWTVQNSLMIDDPDNYMWESGINNGFVQQVWYQGTFNIKDYFYIEQSAPKQRLGVLFKGVDGVDDIAVWRDITLAEINFGESDCKVSIDVPAISYSSVAYVVNNTDGCDSYYVGYTDSEDIESFARGLILTQKLSSFGTEVIQANLTPETKYNLVVVPVDADGLFGNYVSKEITTTKVESVTAQEVKATLKSAKYTSLVYDVVLDSESTHALYYTFTDDEYTTDDEMMTKLGTNIYSQIAASGEFTVTGTSNGAYIKNNTSYNTWIVPVDKYGRLGKVTKLKDKTEQIAFGGTGSVSIVVDEFIQQEFGAKAKVTISPDENLSGYYFKTVDVTQIDGLSDEALVELLFNPYVPPTYKTESFQIAGYDGNGEYVYEGSYLLVLPVDKENRLCQPVKFKIEKPK